MTTDTDDADALLLQLFERPAAQWSAGLDDLCRQHPAHATELRRRHALLAETGLHVDPAPAAPLQVPETVGDFRLLRRLGSGGMGMVYAAEQRSLGRTVAIKFVRPELTFSSSARDRFRREIEAIAQLEHPAIVPILMHGHEGDAPYYVMPLVVGASCDEAIERLQRRDPARLTGADLRAVLDADAAHDASGVFATSYWRACVQLIRQAALGLEHAHSHGVVHRDVKPANILLTADGRALLLDFGLAHVRGDPRLTRSGATPGSPAYMSPEQVRGGALDGRTDVYSLATTLHHLLALRHPLPVEDSDALRTAILTGRREPLHNDAVPTELRIVLAAAMDPDAERRHATARAFADDLLAVLEQRPIVARELPWRLRLRRWMQRHPAASTALGLGAVLFLATPLLVALGIAGERDRALTAEAAASRNAYEANIAAAGAAVRAGDRVEAERRLAACPAALRGFEWRHLHQALTGALRELVGHAAPITAIALRDDGSWLASADANAEVRLWRPLGDAAPVSVPLPDRLPVEAIAVAGDGSRVAVVQTVAGASPDLPPGPTIRVVDTATGRVVAERASTALGERVLVEAGGDRLLVLHRYTAVELDAFTLDVRRTVPLEATGAPPGVFLACDGSWLFGISKNMLQAWRLADGAGSVVHEAFDSGVFAAAIAGIGKGAVFAMPSGFKIARVEPLRIERLEGAGREYCAVATDVNGTFLAAVGADHAFRAWSTADGRMLAQAFGRAELGRQVAIASMPLVAVVGDAGGGLCVHSLFGGNERQQLAGHSGIVSTLATTADGVLLSAAHEPSVRAWQPTTGAPLGASYTPMHHVNAMAVGNDGLLFVAFGSAIQRMRLPDLTLLGSLVVDELVRHLTCDADGRLLAALPDRLLQISSDGARVLASVARSAGPTRACTAAPAADTVWLATNTGIEQWRCTPELRLVANLPVAGAKALACTQDGRTLFTAEGRWLRRREVPGGAVVWERQCARLVTSLALLPDGSRLVAGHQDGSVSLWQLEDCSGMATLQAGMRPIRALVADPACHWLAAADEASTVTLFRADTGELPFATRLLGANHTAASWLDQRLRRQLRTRPDVLAAIAALDPLDARLREAIAQAERLRPLTNWEEAVDMYWMARQPGQSRADYERALHVAEITLEAGPDFEHARLCAALANLRLGQVAEGLRHLELLERRQPPVPGVLTTTLGIRAMAMQRLGRIDEAKAALAAMEEQLRRTPDADDRVLYEEVREALAR